MIQLALTASALALVAGGAAAQGLTAQSYASSIGTSDAMIAGAERFEAESGVDVTYNAIPSSGYNDAVNAAAAAGDLPDVLMIDGPNLANYVWAGYLQPLDDLVDPALVADMTPAMEKQGTYGPDGGLYCIGPVDAGLSILGNRAYLEAAGVRIPTGIDDAWTREEFEAALAALAELEEVDAPLDMKLNYGVSEWLTYAFSPMVQSMGGDLIDRETWRAEGTINGPETVAALAMVQGWQENGWIVPGTAGDATFYGDKTAALSWTANWSEKPSREALGDDLVLLPMPDFGSGPVTALGSWCWTITRDAADPEAAARLLEALLDAETIKGMYDAGVYPPGRISALTVTPRYDEGGDLALYQQQLTDIAVERPVYPGYPVISSAFQRAFDDVLNGADPQEALDAAARDIDQDIEDNAGYPPFGG